MGLQLSPVVAGGGSGGSVAIGGAVTGGTEGSVLFLGVGGILAQDNTNFFWNDTTNRLGLGTSTTTYRLTLGSGGMGLDNDQYIFWKSTVGGNPDIAIGVNVNNDIRFLNANSVEFAVPLVMSGVNNDFSLQGQIILGNQSDNLRSVATDGPTAIGLDFKNDNELNDAAAVLAQFKSGNNIRFSISGLGNVLGVGSIQTNTSLVLQDPGVGTNTITVQSPTLAGSYTLTLPTTDGDANQVLTTDGSGVLSWTTPVVGDITAVGDVASGAAFNGTQGTTITFFNGGGNMTLAYDGTTLATSKALKPSADDSAALGISGTAFADLFLASGGVINWNAGNVTITQSAATLTFNSTALTGLASVATPIINSLDAVASAVTIQNQTFTPGAGHNAVVISPTWTAENQIHTALNITPTQNGTNTQVVQGIRISMTKATAATTLASMNGIFIFSPSITGTVTSSNAISISDQTNANITTARGVMFGGTGAPNSIVWGNSALQYSNGANDVRFMDSTNARGISLALTAAGAQTIAATGGTLTLTTPNIGVATGTSLAANTLTSADAVATTLNLNSQTFTPGAQHAAVTSAPIWTAENQFHFALSLTPTQNGANSSGMNAINITMTKATGATTLAFMKAISIGSPSVTGTVTASEAITIFDQTNANITTPRGIKFFSTGVANSIVWGSSALQYAAGAEDVRFMDSTNARGVSLTLTAAGNQSIAATGGDLSVTSKMIMTGARFQGVQGADVGSANDLTLGTGNAFEITGTTQINAITVTNWQNGSMITLLFTSNPTVKHNTAGGGGTAVILLAGAVDFGATAGDTLTLLLSEIGGTQAWRECARTAI